MSNWILKRSAGKQLKVPIVIHADTYIDAYDVAARIPQGQEPTTQQISSIVEALIKEKTNELQREESDITILNVVKNVSTIAEIPGFMELLNKVEYYLEEMRTPDLPF